MHDYTVNLALFDYVPIALSAMAMIYICRIAGDRGDINGLICRSGAVLIISGGLLKATWKLIVAASGHDIVWMNKALFICLAPGFVLLSSALLLPRAQNMTRNSLLVICALLIAVYALLTSRFPEQRYGFFWLLSITTLGNAVMIATLTMKAWRVQHAVASLLFVASFVGTLTLSGLARIPEQTAALQWLEEGINTLAQLALLLGSLNLYRRIAMPEEKTL